MSTRKYAKRLQVECTGLMAVRIGFIATIFLSLHSVAVLPLPLLLRLLLMLTVVLFARRCWLGRCELGAPPVTLTWDADDRWWWRQAGRETEMRLCGDSYLSTGLILLNFRYIDSRVSRSLVLFPAAVGIRLFRRLRVRLRLSGHLPGRDKDGKLGGRGANDSENPAGLQERLR